MKYLLVSLEDNSRGLFEYQKKVKYAFESCNVPVETKYPPLSYTSSLKGNLKKLIKYFILDLFNLKAKNELELNDDLKAYEKIIITDSPIYTLFFAKLLLKSYKGKIFITLHDPIPHSTDKAKRKILNILLSILNKKLFKSASELDNLYLIVHDTSGLDKFKYRADKIIATHHPLPAPLSFTEDNFSLKKYRYVFTFMGRIEYYKGIDIFLESVIQFNRTHNDGEILFVIAGGGVWDFSDYENESNLLIINKFLNTEEYNSVLYYSDVIVLPYRDATQSGVLTDAKANGKIIIVNNVGTLSKYLKPNDLILDELSTEALCSKYTAAVDRIEKSKKYLKTPVDVLEEVHEFNKANYVDFLIKI
ncbi:glycosyltransferase [Pontibacter sp. KCTC 32443]|uniref:glycosyltransferase n=1 Tax=Pontibacter TaxID=323449 RepID=UPI00164CFCCF|nr:MULTISPECIES: glycosyltransferase [Pontibacter]MBC5773008.1 glycosyltransferase [Pontibacter sp. KCTC 32443]